MKQKRTKTDVFDMKRYNSPSRILHTIKELPSSKRPREKLQLNGSDSLSDLELIALLIGSGTTRQPTLTLARHILDHLDQVPAEKALIPEDLTKIDGVGIAKATLICAALELGRRRLPPRRKQVVFPSDVYPLIRHYGSRQQELFICVSLNGAHEVMSVNVVSIGLVNHTLVHPREVFA
jgi:DNA repair protein RadC